MMDRFGFLSEYLNDSGGDGNCIITDDPDDCGLFFSQQPKDVPFYTKDVQDEINFDGLFEDKSEWKSVEFELMVFNQKVTECQEMTKSVVDVYSPVMEPISDDENPPKQDVR